MNTDITLRDTLLQLAKTHQIQLHPAAAKAFIAHAKSAASALDERVDIMRALLHVVAVGATRGVDAKAAQDAIAATTVGGAQEDAMQGRQCRFVAVSAVPHVAIDPLRLTMDAVTRAAETRGVKADALRQRYLLALAKCKRAADAVTQDAADASETVAAGSVLRIRTLEGQRIGSIVRVLGVLRLANVDPAATASASPTSATTPMSLALEDADGTVAITLAPRAAALVGAPTEQGSALGYFCVGHVVVATGKWTGAAIADSVLSFPPCESRARTTALLGEMADFFGGRIKGELPPRASAVISVVSHCALDSTATIAALKQLFTTCEEQREFLDVAATTFVLVGNFCSSARASTVTGSSSSKAILLADPAFVDDAMNSRQRLLTLFDQLAAMLLSTAPTVAQQAQFILVPGPDDPCCTAAGLPQGPLSAAVAEPFLRRIPRVSLASNPCRLRCGTFEMVLIRSDLQRHLMRHAVALGHAGDTVPPFEHVVHTIAESGSLLPADGLVNWKDDRLLQLYPLPHAVCVCDSATQWDAVHRGTRFFNPGPFDSTRTFAWITPAEGTIDFNRAE